MKNVYWILLISLFIIAYQGCQSRALSRYTGRALKLDLPEDFDKPISFKYCPTESLIFFLTMGLGVGGLWFPRQTRNYF